MQKGIVLNQQDVREIIAEHFGVPAEDVINSKYSYIVIEKGGQDGNCDNQME